MPVQHNLDSERELWDTYAAGIKDDVFASPRFGWTQYAGHGPGPELLGEPRSVLEIGCGSGRALAALAEQGVRATGLDLSPVMVAKVTERWKETGAQFICGDALDHLSRTADTFDAVYSVFGAAWFTDPARLLPLIARRLNPGGRLVFSQAPAIPGAYGPQGMYKGGFAGPAMYAYRYSYTPRRWHTLLQRAGFVDPLAEVLDAPTPGHIGTLIVRAVKAP
ncbi:class I SAM-dependent methyltransferase [Streptacidiphilus sp. 4-A2]|nr:class I SAM-dependent methyltransferase [Streptacidiphilus sp. 4-A2]